MSATECAVSVYEVIFSVDLITFSCLFSGCSVYKKCLCRCFSQSVSWCWSIHPNRHPFTWKHDTQECLAQGLAYVCQVQHQNRRRNRSKQRGILIKAAVSKKWWQRALALSHWAKDVWIHWERGLRCVCVSLCVCACRWREALFSQLPGGGIQLLHRARSCCGGRHIVPGRLRGRVCERRV